jgi:nucleoside-diphosphate-sugar epimerase
MSTGSSASVVVLGASGFVGTAIARELEAAGAAVIACSSRTVDLAERGAARRLAEIVPEGAAIVLASATRERGDRLETFEKNAAIAASVAEHLRARPARCVFLSSSSVYGFARTRRDVAEDAPLEPTNHYGIAKAASEWLLARAAGASLVVLRAPRVFGPGDPTDLYGPAVFARSIARDRRVRLFGDGEDLRDHVHVADLARIVRRFALGEGAPGLYNVATERARSYREIADAFAEIVAPERFAVVSVERDRPKIDLTLDAARLRRALPDLEATPLARALAETYRALLEKERKEMT